MKELMAELLECTCLQQGREALAESIIARHMEKYAVEQQVARGEQKPITTDEITDMAVKASQGFNAGNSVSA